MPGHKDIGATATEREITIRCSTDQTDGEGNMYIRACRMATLMNGRLYRQARTYRMKFAVKVAPEHDGGTQVNYEFFTLPNTYFVHGAIKYAYDTYRRQLADEIASGIKPSRWNDFILNPQNPTGAWEDSVPVLWDATAGAGWASLAADQSLSNSSITDAGGTSKGFNVLGNVANSYNIFREYANKLNYREEPGAISSTQPFDGLADNLDDADELTERGDLAPYDRDWSSFLPDDATVDDDSSQHILTHRGSISLNADSAQGRLSTGYFTAPLGLVWVRKYLNGSEGAFDTIQPELVLTFAPGSYKGVDSHSLT